MRLFLALLLLATPAAAQVACADRDVFVARYENQSLTLFAQALTDDGIVVEIFVRPDDQRWGVILSHPNGLTCEGAHGAHFEIEPLPTPGVDG